MMNIQNKISIKMLLSVLLSSLLLSACSDNDDEPAPTPPPEPVVYQFDVSVTNLTHAQPMSPVAVLLHNEGQLWQIGSSASVALETLAESGDNSAVLAETMVLAQTSGSEVLMPGTTQMLSVMIEDTAPMMLSLASMLVNTNDAFTGINAMSIGDLAVGESISVQTSSYDAGTEKNSEQMATIPGPAGGGEGFNAARDDVDFVAMHGGVVSVDDGLMLSALTQAHRFDNPTLSITITRTE